MEVQITVEGSTYNDLKQKLDAAVSSFLTGAAEGTTATVIDVGLTQKIGDVPAGWDGTIGKVLTLPLFQNISRWSINDPS